MDARAVLACMSHGMYHNVITSVVTQNSNTCAQKAMITQANLKALFDSFATVVNSKSRSICICDNTAAFA